MDLDLQDVTEYFEFFDALRASARVNMWGAARELEKEYPELGGDVAKRVHAGWMKTFKGDGKPAAERAAAFIDAEEAK